MQQNWFFFILPTRDSANKRAVCCVSGWLDIGSEIDVLVCELQELVVNKATSLEQGKTTRLPRWSAVILETGSRYWSGLVDQPPVYEQPKFTGDGKQPRCRELYDVSGNSKLICVAERTSACPHGEASSAFVKRTLLLSAWEISQGILRYAIRLD